MLNTWRHLANHCISIEFLSKSDQDNDERIIIIIKITTNNDDINDNIDDYNDDNDDNDDDGDVYTTK